MRAAIYSRISNDAEEEGKGVARQRQDCEALCERSGFTVVRVYEDNDISASTLSRKIRPQYGEMLDAARAGEFDVIVAYSNSRLSRRPAEWLDLINLSNNHKIEIRTVVSGSHDLSTADGKAVAMTIAIWDAAEAERTGERLKRQKRQRAEDGKKHGGRYRVYGYDRKYAVIPHEAAIVREAFKRRAAGESSTSIASDLASRGLLTVSERPWTSNTLIKLFQKPEYAGLMRLNGEIIGRTAYDAIIDEPTFHAVSANLAKDKKGTNARVHLLSGFLVCSKCLNTMKGNRAGGKPSYRCPSPKTLPGACGACSIKAPDTDLAVFNAAWGKWQDDFLNDNVEPVDQVRDYQAEVDVIDQRKREAQDAFRSGALPIGDFTALNAALNRERAELIKAEAVNVVHDLGILQPMMDWDSLSLSQKRIWLSGFVENIVVHPPTQGARAGYDKRRLEIHYKDGTVERLTKGERMHRIHVGYATEGERDSLDTPPEAQNMP